MVVSGDPEEFYDIKFSIQDADSLRVLVTLVLSEKLS